MRVSLDLNALLGAGAALVVILGGIAAGYVNLRKWIQTVAAPVQQTAAQLQTSNGTTVAGYVEKTATRIEQMQETIAQLSERSVTNRDLATAAHALAKANEERLDRHLQGHA